MKSFTRIKVLMIIILCYCLPGLVYAEPYLAQRYGLQCSGCHSNVTGGGKRNTTGVAYAAGLSTNTVVSPFSPNIADAISVGGNFRADWSYTNFDDPDNSPQGIIGEELEDTSAFNVSNGTLYLDFALSDKISFYLDQQVAPEGGRTREAFGLYKGVLGENDYVKAGKFFLPFGLRLQDDDAFIREVTGFNFDNTDIGLEYGAEHGPLFYAVSVTNGTQGSGENNTDKQVSSLVSLVFPAYRIGLSASKNNAINGNSQEVYGLFAGVTLGKWVLLGEVDAMESTSAGSLSDTALIGFLSVDYLLTPSTNVKFSYDFLDPDDTIPENERTRFSLVGETFTSQYSQFRYGVRRYDGIPQNTFQNQTVIFSELHVFF